MLTWLIERLKERNTWQGLALLLTVFGLHIPTEVLDAAQSTAGLVFQGIAAVIALVAIIKQQKTIILGK